MSVTNKLPTILYIWHCCSSYLVCPMPSTIEQKEYLAMIAKCNLLKLKSKRLDLTGSSIAQCSLSLHFSRWVICIIKTL